MFYFGSKLDEKTWYRQERSGVYKWSNEAKTFQLISDLDFYLTQWELFQVCGNDDQKTKVFERMVKQTHTEVKKVLE